RRQDPKSAPDPTPRLRTGATPGCTRATRYQDLRGILSTPARGVPIGPPRGPESRSSDDQGRSLMSLLRRVERARQAAELAQREAARSATSTHLCPAMRPTPVP